MRIVTVIVAFAMIAGASRARADDATVRKYAGQIVISPDPVPSTAPELAQFLAANATKDSHYELIKGAPWQINLVGVPSRDPGTGTLTLVFSDASDKHRAALQAIDVPITRHLVTVQTSATVAAGFKPHTTYLLRLLDRTRVVAHAELTLSD